MKLKFRRGAAFATQKARNYLKDKNPQDIKSVTVIRHAAIGDFMNIRPFLTELREFFPNAKITLNVLRSSMYGMPNDLIDDVFVMDKIDVETGKSATLFERIRQAKSIEPQDIVFDLTDSTLSLLFAFFSSSKLKIGYSYNPIRRFFYDISTLRSGFLVEAESVLQQLNILGCKTQRPLRYSFEERYPKSLKKRIVYFAGASVKEKRWEEKKFISLIDKMSKKYPDYKHAILQGIKDDEKFLEIKDALSENENVVLQEALSLDDALRFLSNSEMLISNDTGVRNMAIATRTPTIGIFFDIPPFGYWPREEKHDCVFNIDFVSPSVEDVYDASVVMMGKLYD